MIYCKYHKEQFTSNGCCPLCPQVDIKPLIDYTEEDSIKVWQDAVRYCGNCEQELHNDDCHNLKCECCNKETIRKALHDYNKDPFGKNIESNKRVKFFNERLSKYGNSIIESLLLETMDNVYEACGELVGVSNMTEKKLNEHLTDARMIILKKLVSHLQDEELKAEKESVLFYWKLNSKLNDKL